MPNVRLYGSSGRTTVNVPPPSGKGNPLPIPPPAETDSRHRKAVFAALSDMETLFDTAGISTLDYWEMVKSEFGIVSRSELSEPMWARLSATLNACRRDPTLFNRLVAKVKAHREALKPPLTDAAPVIFADPEDTITNTCFVIRRDRIDGTEKVVFVGEFTGEVRERCQAHADKTRCLVQFYHAGRKPETFYPTRAGCSPL